MNVITVANRTWTPLSETGLEVYQESGGTMAVTVHDDRVTLHLGAVWSVRSATWQPSPDDASYLAGRQSVTTLLDIGAHTHDTITSLLTKAETVLVTAHYNRDRKSVV